MSTLSGREDDRDLTLTLQLSAPRATIWQCWTQAALLKQWFAPAPWTTSHAELDVRPGGANLIVMRSPDGEEFPNRGVYLEVVPEERLVFTDAYFGAWDPSDKPFMTVIIALKANAEGGTDYTALARHWTVEDRAAHEAMGFRDGWTQCARQLEALAQRLKP